MRRRAVHMVLAGLAIAAVAALAAGCQQGKDTSDEPETVGGMAETVRIEDFAYAPGNLRVPTGATITFVNDDEAVHDAEDLDGRWATEGLSRGEEDAITLTSPGVYEYHCSFHPSMKARIVVGDGGGA